MRDLGDGARCCAQHTALHGAARHACVPAGCPQERCSYVCANTANNNHDHDHANNMNITNSCATTNITNNSDNTDNHHNDRADTTANRKNDTTTAPPPQSTATATATATATGKQGVKTTCKLQGLVPQKQPRT